MLLQQYYLGCLAHASYLIADEVTGTAAVVDPQRDIDQYLTDAEAHGWHIRFVFLTHFHADFLAGHLELHERTGAAICLGARAQADYAVLPFSDGEMLTFGQFRLTVLETPGHTPEAISILVYDLAQNASRPHAVLTGDTLFIGDVGRPDLMASCGVSATELAGMLYDSLHHKLLTLPGYESEAAMRLGRIGFDHVAGYLAGGIDAVAPRPDLTRQTERMTPLTLAAALASVAPPLLLDVRTPQEQHTRYIAGSLHIPLPRLQRQIHDVSRGHTMVVYCAGGYRSS